MILDFPDWYVYLINCDFLLIQSTHHYPPWFQIHNDDFHYDFHDMTISYPILCFNPHIRDLCFPMAHRWYIILIFGFQWSWLFHRYSGINFPMIHSPIDLFRYPLVIQRSYMENGPFIVGLSSRNADVPVRKLFQHEKSPRDNGIFPTQKITKRRFSNIPSAND